MNHPVYIEFVYVYERHATFSIKTKVAKGAVERWADGGIVLPPALERILYYNIIIYNSVLLRACVL